MLLVSFRDSAHIAPKCGFFFIKSRNASLLSWHCFLYFWKWSSESFFMSRSTMVGLTTKWWALSALSFTVTKWFLLIHFSLEEKKSARSKFSQVQAFEDSALTCRHKAFGMLSWGSSQVLLIRLGSAVKYFLCLDVDFVTRRDYPVLPFGQSFP